MSEIKPGDVVLVEGTKYISFAWCMGFHADFSSYPRGLFITRISKINPDTHNSIDFGYIPSMFRAPSLPHMVRPAIWHKRCRPISIDQFRMLLTQYSKDKDIYLKTTLLVQKELNDMHQFFNP